MKIKQYFLPLYVFGFFVFLYLPIVILTIYSFNFGGFPAEWKGFSMHWYCELFDSVEIWRAFLNSGIVALTASFLSVVFGVMFVYGSRKHKLNMTSIFYTNILVPDIVLAVGLLSLFSYFFIPLGLITLVVGHTLLGLGFAIPVLKARLDELDNRLVEASLDLGATPFYTFNNVVLPFLYPAILVSTLLVIIISFDDFLISFFCSGSSVQTLSLYIYTMIRAGISPTVNALSTIMLLVSTVFVFVISWINIRLAQK